jgi:multiple sugar transport system substrate-binding protein
MGRDDIKVGLRRRASRMQLTRSIVSVSLVALAAVVATGCGGSADSAAAGQTPVLGFMTWRDPTGLGDKLVASCEKQAKGRYRIDQIPMGNNVDAAHEQVTRRLAAGDDTIDMLNLDTIWTAEFADAGWLVDLTAQVAPVKDTFLPSSLVSTFYRDKYWAYPVNANAAMLYYRKDLIKTPPRTWEELSKQSMAVQAQHPDMIGFAFQGAPSESGSVDAMEFLLGAGAKVLSDDGKKSTITDGDAAVHAFSFLQQMMKDGVAPRVVTTFTENESLQAFQGGNAVFMRNWPYAYTMMNADKASKVKGKFDVAPLPQFEGHDPVAVLGGQNWAVATTSKHPKLALEAIQCLGGREAQKQRALVKGEFSALADLYKDPDIVKAYPFIETLSTSLGMGQSRAVSPYYNDVSTVIYKAYNDVLQGNISPEQATKRIDHGVQLAIEGKAEI